MLKAGTDQAVLDVTGGSRSKQRRLLRDQTYLRTQPIDIEVFELDAIERDAATNRVTNEVRPPSAVNVEKNGEPKTNSLEALDQTDDRRLARARSTNECSGLASREHACKLVQHLDARSTRVEEVDVLDLDDTTDAVGLESSIRCRVNDGNTIDSVEKRSASCDGEGDGLNLWSELGKGECTDEHGEEDSDDLATCCLSFENQSRAVIEGQTVRSVTVQSPGISSGSLVALRCHAYTTKKKLPDTHNIVSIRHTACDGIQRRRQATQLDSPNPPPWTQADFKPTLRTAAL